MQAVVTKASKVTCGHSGIVITVGAPKLTVDGSPVLLAAGVNLQSIPVKPTPGFCATPSSSTSNPCTQVSTVDPASLSTKLFVSGAPVVLATLAGTTNGMVGGTTPQAKLKAIVTQTHLISV